MKVYIFGAGASAGSQLSGQVGIDRLKAPLVDHLFDEQYLAYAQEVFVDPSRIKALQERIKDQPLETWLTEEWNRVGAPHGKETLAAGRKMFGDLAIYIWWMMVNVSKTYGHMNGYRLFLQKLVELDDRDEQAFVNFNYDLLLDKALVEVFGYDLSSSLDKYTTLNYLKPHGSVNWFVDLRPNDPRVNIMDRSVVQPEVFLSRIAGLMFRGEPIAKVMTILDPLNSNLYDLEKFFEHTYVDGKYGFPLVMLPLSAKMYDLVEEFMTRMKAEFDRIFSQATDIYLIGYRANDELFRTMISKAQSAKLHVVSQSDPTAIQKAVLRTANNLTAGELHSGGFYNFIQQMK